MKKILADLNIAEVKALVTDMGLPAFRAKQISEFLHAGAPISEMSSLSTDTRAKLLDEYEDVAISVEKKFVSKDGTIKYLYRLADGNLIEGVLMTYKYGKTLCISTQVGCRMNCGFCASGIGGLVRNLTPGEIFSQFSVVNREQGGNAKNRQVINIVLMGSGEPLDNYDNVMKFFELCAEAGISMRNISLSTSGIVPGIIKLADSGVGVTLTLSLHSTQDERRSKLMPVNKKYPIGELIEAGKYYFKKTGRRVIFEYCVIAGENDSDGDVARLKRLTAGFPAHVNLIPLNKVEEKDLRAPSRKAVEEMARKLTELGVSATVRRTMGQDINGACGQLRRSYLEGKA